MPITSRINYYAQWHHGIFQIVYYVLWCTWPLCYLLLFAFVGWVGTGSEMVNQSDAEQGGSCFSNGRRKQKGQKTPISKIICPVLVFDAGSVYFFGCWTNGLWVQLAIIWTKCLRRNLPVRASDYFPLFLQTSSHSKWSTTMFPAEVIENLSLQAK